ncbi:cyclohexanone monooxygenase [Capronia epimyces CBS 606.96]|uniref:Cyclohexanone monooxygenase n=1 Tax=Capronia epimyces CBS 606.96 TaxID=1182542 RepID=W9XME7_9EURO|nr:cyclohexanone monooxygenase [Capronia epimyces CBS 606.96]EXJ78156.1 cyclohexanone monooxygenase [Capronia epimyces CBS 606.96]
MGSTTEVDYDAIVIGAGFAGLRTLYELRSRGLSVKGFEKGSDVGGTWYWNRYPGARTDSEAWVYIMNISKELNSEWTWSERLPGQAEVQRYLHHIADRFNLRQQFEFNTRIASAEYNSDRNVWTVTTSTGQSYTSTFLITASGPLSSQRRPPFDGLDSFQGKWYQTSSWPKEGVDLVGKRVAVIGTGATGVQVIPIVAHEAESLTVFQRTPNYVIPGRNHSISPELLGEIRRNYDQVWNQARGHVFGLAYSPADRTVADVNEAEHQEVLERGWETGGFRFVFESFDDVLLDPKSNEAMAEFVRNKIRTIVKDKKTAELLSPKYPFLAKRPPLGHFYYEAYNRPNVKLVDISDNPIKELTPKGIRTQSGDEYEFDVIIFAIGFDVATGALTDMDIRGRDHTSLSEKWSKTLETFLGITVPGFPNLFMASGPQSPFANIPVCIDHEVNFIGRAISDLRQHGHTKMEPTEAAALQWATHVEESFKATLLGSSSAKVHSWYVGANVPGKPQNVQFYFGGVGNYFAQIEKEAAAGFPSFEKS